MKLLPDFLYDIIIPCPETYGNHRKWVPIPELPFYSSDLEVEMFIGCYEGCLLLKVCSPRGFGFPNFPAVNKGDRLEFFIDSKKSFDLSEQQVGLSYYHRFYCLPSLDSEDTKALARVLLKTRDFREHLLCEGLQFKKYFSEMGEIVEITLPLRSLYGYRYGQKYLGFAWRLVIEGAVFSFPFQEKDGFILEDNPLFWSFLDLGGV